MGRNISFTLVLCLVLAGYVLAGLLGMQAHMNPTEMDTTAYLSAAHQIRETGGILKHVENCWKGVYREATQHPIYLLILSTFAEPNIHFFIRAKIASVIIGFIFLLVFFFLVKGVLGRGAALIASGFLLLSTTFIHLSSMVACEGLFALFFLCFWFFAVEGFKNNKFWLLAGLFAATTFLSKSLGIFTLPIFFFSVFFMLHKEWKKVLKNQYFLGFFVVFFIVSSPLFIRNAKFFGTPLYSDSKAVMWIDKWRDYYRPDIMKNPPTLKTYLQTHTPSQIAATFSAGIFVRTPKMISDGLKPFAFWQKSIDLKKLQGFYERTVWWQEIWAFLLLILCAIGLWRDRRSPAAIIASASLLLFILFVAWYSKVFPGNPPTRLLYPVLFFVWIYTAKVLWEEGEAFFVRAAARWREIWAVILVGIFATLYIALLLFNFNWQKLDIRKSFAFGNPFLSELFWVTTHVKPGEKIIVGSVFLGHNFYFQKAIKGEVISWPQVDSLDELSSFIHEKGIRYGILDLPTVAYNMEVYGPYFQVGPKIGMRLLGEPPPHFKKIHEDPSPMILYEIYEFDTA